MKISNIKINKSSLTKFALTTTFLGSIALDAFATYTPVSGTATSNTFTDVMCNVLRVATGNAGKAFAAFAIISVGIGFFTGKVSWGLMVGVAAGIAAMFGAPQIVAAISGTNSASC